MSDDASGFDAASDGADDWEATDAPTTGSTPRIEEPVPHSRLVGLMAVPISRSVPIRRSTALMLMAFLGFGTLCYLYPPNSPASSSTGSGGIPGVFVPTPTTTTTTTRPPATTTTTRVSGSTTTSTPTTTTSQPVTTTTASTRPVGSTTTTAPHGSTTTTAPGAVTTSTAP